MVCRLEVQLVATTRPTTSDEGLEVVECANGEVAELVLASTGPEFRALVTDIAQTSFELNRDIAKEAALRRPGRR
jgi:hypothetical protein